MRLFLKDQNHQIQNRYFFQMTINNDEDEKNENEREKNETITISMIIRSNATSSRFMKLFSNIEFNDDDDFFFQQRNSDEKFNVSRQKNEIVEND